MRPKGFRAFNSLHSTSSRADWFRISNNDNGADIYLYDDIGWFGTTAEGFIDQLNAVDATDVRVHINSGGGDVFDALAIHSALRKHKAHVTTYVDGLAASAASYIALAGDKVVTARNAMWMIHDASTLEWGNPAAMRKCADLLDQVSDNIADFYAQKAGGSVAGWRALMSEETWYTGAEAVDHGLADEIEASKKRQNSGDDGPVDDIATRIAARALASLYRYKGRDDAPAPKLVDRERRFSASSAEPVSAEALDWLRAQKPQSITVSSTGAATTTITYDADANAALVSVLRDEIRREKTKVADTLGSDAPVVAQDAEPVADEPADVEPEVSPAVEAQPTEATGQDEPTEPADTPEADPTPAEQPATDGEPAADGDHAPAGPPPPATTEPEPTDEWAALVTHLTHDPESIEDALARLREACK